MTGCAAWRPKRSFGGVGGRETSQPATLYNAAQRGPTGFYVLKLPFHSLVRAIFYIYIYHVMTSGSGHRQRLRNAAAVKSFFFFSVIFVGSSVCELTDTRVSGF